MSYKENQKSMEQSTLKTDEVLNVEGVDKVSEVEKASQNTETTPSVTSTVKEVPQTLTGEELAALDYSEFNTPARMLALGTVLSKSKLVPLKTPEDVAVALMTGNELGLPFVTSVSQIYPINGRPTLGVHIQKALCLKHGVTFEKIEDAVEIFEFVATDDKGIVKTVKNVPIVIGKGTVDKQPKNSKKRPVDRRTTYEFSRLIKRPNGSWKEMTARGSFTLSEAKEAELVDKDVWQKYWRRMLDARAFTNGVGEIADDITLGLRSPSEISTNFYVNESGEEVHVASVEN